MPMSEIALREKILVFLMRYPNFADCYIGITNKPLRRLFEQHKVNRADTKAWVYGQANTIDVARRVEQYFIDLGCAGEPGGGEEDSTFVYAYKITEDTIETN